MLLAHMAGSGVRANVPVADGGSPR
jgi:hypothetical protein